MRFLPHLSKTRLTGFSLFVLLLVLVPLHDPDYFWHLKTGEYIAAHRALPDGDVFSFSLAGQPWVLHEWLFEAVLYQVYAAFGDAGVATLTVGLALGALSLSFVAACRLAGTPGPVWIAAAIGGFALAGGVAPRPQLLTYFLFAVYLLVLLGFKYGSNKGAARPLFLLPPLMVVWVNAHAGYAVGIALLVLFTLCEWPAWLGERVDERRRRLHLLCGVTGLTVLASLANPGLFERWLYPFQVMGMAVNELIQEWQSPNFHQFGPKAYLALVLLYLVASTYARRKPDLGELLLPLCFSVLGFVSARHMPLATLVLIPFTAQALSRGPLAAVKAWLLSRRPIAWYLARRGVGKELGGGEQVLNWVVAALVALCLPPLLRAQQPEQARQAARLVPAGAADFIAAHALHGRLFNAYDDGGYLIWRLAPQAKVMIDGRADLYGDRFIGDYLGIYQGGADWQARFARLNVDLAVLPLDAPIRQLLLGQARFREVYRDKHYSVLQPAAGSFASGSIDPLAR